VAGAAVAVTVELVKETLVLLAEVDSVLDPVVVTPPTPPPQTQQASVAVLLKASEPLQPCPLSSKRA